MLRQVMLLVAMMQTLATSAELSADKPGAAAQTSSRTSQGMRPPEHKTLTVNGVPSSLDIAIAAGAAGDEDLVHGVYLFSLKCSADISCNFERLTLNECTTARKGEANFSPRVDSWSTTSGLLEVKQLANEKVQLTVYQAFGHQLPAKVLLTFAAGDPPFRKLTDFKTTGFVDLRFWPNVGVPIDYVPLRHDRTKRLDCPALLRGLAP